MYPNTHGQPPPYPGFQQQQGMYAAPSPGLCRPPTVYQQQQNASEIRDYLIWSILNLLFGWVIGGILPLVFSLICRSNKNVNDYSGAKTMSTLALIFNILVTIGGLMGWIGLIASLAIAAAAVSSSGVYP